MWKKVLVASAIFAVAGATFVQAQRFGGDGRGPMPGNGAGPTLGLDRFQFSADDLAAFTDARIAAIKAGLRLTPEHEKNWPAFEAAYRNFAKLRTDRVAARREQTEPPSNDPMERLQRRADSIGRSADAYKQLADNTAPLYRSLDDGQKRRFTVLTRLMRSGMAGRGFRRDGHGPGPMGPGNMRRDGFGPDQFQRGGFKEPKLQGEGDVERIQYRTLPLESE
ncbi:MAG: Spy/CpxP family protein refolding chaperone [Rhizomicrobium sp.]